MTNIFSKSKDYKPEYSCSVVKIQELIPIEDSDFLAKTTINGTQVVVRKDQVSEGDIMFYAENETALNANFLSINNLFEIGCREMNSNKEEVELIMEEYNENYRNKALELKSKAKKIKSTIISLTKSANRLQKMLDKENKKYESISDEDEKAILNISILELREKIDSKTKKAMAETVKYTQTKAEVDKLVELGKPIVDKAKQLCGFFNKYGRVRCIKLKNEPSFGFVFGQSEMGKYYPNITSIDLEKYIGEDFDTVNGELFVKAYVPPVKPVNHKKNKNEKRNKELSRFDRLVQGEFLFHYDSTPLQKNIHLFSPTDNIIVSNKLHGTSCVIGKLHVKEPKKIELYKRLWNKFVDVTNLFKSSRIIDYNIVYGPIYSSRTVIKNQYINKDVGTGYYGTDIWTEWGDKIYPYLDNGMTIYGEIVGYITGKETMIQKTYDYGCEPGTNKLMIYRISTILSDGSKFEWNVNEVYEWTCRLIDRMKENGDATASQIHPIDILYSGTLQDLYPDLDTTDHWHANVLDCLKKDKEHFGMEEYEPLCTYNEVPREGICIRKVNDPILENFKLKTQSFLFGEAVRIDAGETDIEMMENYKELINQQCDDKVD